MKVSTTSGVSPVAVESICSDRQSMVIWILVSSQLISRPWQLHSSPSWSGVAFPKFVPAVQHYLYMVTKGFLPDCGAYYATMDIVPLCSPLEPQRFDAIGPLSHSTVDSEPVQCFSLDSYAAQGKGHA